MTASVNLAELSLSEKLELMEALWDDLCQNPDDVISPKWHERELDNRRSRVADGRAQFLDWESVKSELQTPDK